MSPCSRLARHHGWSPSETTLVIRSPPASTAGTVIRRHGRGKQTAGQGPSCESRSASTAQPVRPSPSYSRSAPRSRMTKSRQYCPNGDAHFTNSRSKIRVLMRSVPYPSGPSSALASRRSSARSWDAREDPAPSIFSRLRRLMFWSRSARASLGGPRRGSTFTTTMASAASVRGSRSSRSEVSTAYRTMRMNELLAGMLELLDGYLETLRCLVTCGTKRSAVALP